MKTTLFILLFLPLGLLSQVIATRTNALNYRSERYVTNSPGNTVGNSRVSDYLQDSIAFESTVDSFRIYSVRSAQNHGTPQGILWTASDGLLRRSPVSAIQLTSGQVTTALGYTPAPFAPTLATVAAGARNFNQAYQVSTTKYVDVRFSASISANLSLSGGQSGEIFLEYSADGSTNWTLAGKISGSNTGTLTVGLNTTQITGSQTSVILPPGYYWRYRTNNITGTPTYTFTGGVEITYN